MAANEQCISYKKGGTEVIDVYRPTWVEVNLQAIKDNFRQIKNHIGPNSDVIAVIKANAYGHGVLPVAKALLQEGAKFFAVSSLEEGLVLREAGITIPVLIFGYIPVTAAELCVKNDLSVTIFDPQMIDELQIAARKQNKKANIHIKIDTGMGRVGIREIAVFKELLNKIQAYTNVVLEGVYTHLACSDEMDKSYSMMQYKQFQSYLQTLTALPQKPLIHISNSGGIIDLPGFSHDFVRLGISLYGYYPSKDVEQSAIKLKPSMEFKTKIVYLKEVEEGQGISYGATYRTNRKSIIATLPVGYADGYNRRLSNCGVVLINGTKAQVVGRVCMDQTMVDVTDVPEVKLGDEVVLFGMQGGQCITVEEMAEQLGTINYEIVCAITNRVPRIYLSS